MKFYDRISLKTKGFSRETEALKLNGGGENRTLVLSKLRKNAYMLSGSCIKRGSALEVAPLTDPLALCVSRNLPPKDDRKTHTRVNDSRTSAPGRALGYRLSKAG